MMLELMKNRKNRAVKRDVDGRDIDEVVSELLAQGYSFQGSVTAIRNEFASQLVRVFPKDNLVQIKPSHTDTTIRFDQIGNRSSKEN